MPAELPNDLPPNATGNCAHCGAENRIMPNGDIYWHYEMRVRRNGHFSDRPVPIEYRVRGVKCSGGGLPPEPLERWDGMPAYLSRRRAVTAPVARESVAA